ncbi:MAG: MBL fold metallo-hydrolase [Spirochaetes bacterium]|nr:MBL fold metallo-hydrolase [Spirochaetota bacterium]
MKIKVYGARGSQPVPLLPSQYQTMVKQVLRIFQASGESDIDRFMESLPFQLKSLHGGNTSCITIEDNTQELIILDGGSGLRVLGNEYKGKKNQVFHIFFSHFHWDHICGIPFFKPLYEKTNTIFFYSPNSNMLTSLCRQMHPSHFPITFSQLPAHKKYILLNDKHLFQLNGYDIQIVPLIHPGGANGYIFMKDGKKISYVTDTEFTPDNIKDKDMLYKAYFESSDLLIMDAQYSLQEFFSKFDWGHSSANTVVNLALHWRAKRLMLFHFDPDHDAEDLERILEEAREQTTNFNRRKLDIYNAVEGTVIQLD